MNRASTEVKTRYRVSAYLYDLVNENRRVVGRLHEDSPGDNFTVVEGLSTQACFSQTACIDQLEHLMTENKVQRTASFLNGRYNRNHRGTETIGQFSIIRIIIENKISFCCFTNY